MWLLCIASAWVVGTFLGARLCPPPTAFAIGVLPLVLAPFLRRQRAALLLASLILMALIGAAFRFQQALPDVGPMHLAYYNGRTSVTLVGVVSDDPERRGRFSQFTLSTQWLELNGQEKQMSGKALVRTPQYPHYGYGDMVRLVGKPTEPPTLPDFDYRGYLSRKGVHTLIYYPEIQLIERGHGALPLKVLYDIRASLSASLARSLPEPEASLAQGMLLGMRSTIPDSVMTAFSHTGTAHLLAISGLHIGIVIAAVLGAAIALFGRRHGIYAWLALCAVWGYALLTGMRPPVVRGAIMASMLLLALVAGRQRSIITPLAFAAAVMVAINPHILWDISFQLSFCAMMGLGFVYPRLKGLCDSSPDQDADERPASYWALIAVRDTGLVTLAATIAVWPLIAYHFHIVPLVGIPASMLSLPALPPIIGGSALVAVTGLVSPVLGQALAWLPWTFITYLLSIVQLFDSIPASALHGISVDAWHLLAYYGALAGGMVLLSRLTRRRADTHQRDVTVGQ
ncbi:MAG: ComEC/Rec2 family competence protein [Chloroflexota bacterium]